MKIIGLAGASNSLRNNLSIIFRTKYNIPTINVELVSNQITNKGMPALEKIVKKFGEECVNDNGHLDRNYIYQNIVADKAKGAKLKKLITAETSSVVKDGLKELEDSGFKLVFVDYGKVPHSGYKVQVVVHDDQHPDYDELGNFIINEVTEEEVDRVWKLIQEMK